MLLSRLSDHAARAGAKHSFCLLLQVQQHCQHLEKMLVGQELPVPQREQPRSRMTTTPAQPSATYPMPASKPSPRSSQGTTNCMKQGDILCPTAAPAPTPRLEPAHRDLEECWGRAAGCLPRLAHIWEERVEGKCIQ